MGKTAFSGPVYGAKSLLWSAHAANTIAASSVTETVCAMQVPSYEDWLITEFKVFRGSSHSTAVTTTYGLTDDSTVIANVVQASGAATSGAQVLYSTILTATPGEYEGQIVEGGSTLGFTYNHGGNTAAVDSNVTAWVYGYIRYKDSTRAV